MPTADHGDVHGEASKERAGEGGDLAVRPVHRRAAGEEHAGVVPGGLRERGDASGQLVADGPQDGADAVPPDVTERAEGVQVRLHPDVVLEEIVVRVIARKLTTLCICREKQGKILTQP